MRRKQRLGVLRAQIGDGARSLSTSSQKGDGLGELWRAISDHARGQGTDG